MNEKLDYIIKCQIILIMIFLVIINNYNKIFKKYYNCNEVFIWFLKQLCCICYIFCFVLFDYLGSICYL